MSLQRTPGFPGGSEVKVSASNAGDSGSIPGSGGSPGEGNGNPLQYSCLENPIDGDAWKATVHRVAKSRTGLSDFTQIPGRFLMSRLQFPSYEESKMAACKPHGIRLGCRIRLSSTWYSHEGSREVQCPEQVIRQSSMKRAMSQKF